MSKAELVSAIEKAEAKIADEVAEMVTGAVEVPTEEAAGVESRICRICAEPLDDWPHLLHGRCYVSTKVIPDDVEADAERRIEEAKSFLEGMAKHNRGLDIAIAESFYGKALGVYEAGDFLRATRLCWLARDAAALVFVEKKRSWLGGHIERLQREGGQTGALELLLTEVDVLLGEGRFIKTFYLILGNKKKQPGAKHLVAAAWKSSEVEGDLDYLRDQLEILAETGIDAPREVASLREEARDVLPTNPWVAQDKVQEAIALVRPLVGEAKKQKRVDFTAVMQLGEIIPPEVAAQLREQASVTNHHCDRGGGDSSKPEERKRSKGRPRKKVRGDRRAADEEAIKESMALERRVPL